MSLFFRCAVAVLCGFSVCSGIVIQPAMAQENMPAPQFVGEFRLSTGLKLGGVEFGGISGLAYDSARQVFVALSDDRSEKAPARFYELKIDVDAKGIAGLDVLRTITLTDLSGAPFAKLGVDPEAVQLLPDGTLVWSSEGDGSGKPAIYVADRDGKALRAFELPAYFMPNAEKTAGIYNNLAHEGLALAQDGRTLFAITENGLVQDGPKTTLEAGSLSRLTLFDVASGKARAEYAYRTETIPQKATVAPYYNDNGISELLTLPDGRLVVMERAFALGLGNTIRLFTIELSGATDLLGRASIKDDASIVTVKKTPWFTLKEGDHGLDIDNIEAIALGPKIDGKQSLLLASDNNFNRNGQFTQFLLFLLN